VSKPPVLRFWKFNSSWKIEAAADPDELSPTMRTASDFFLTEQWVTFTLKTVPLSRVTWSITPVRIVCHVLAGPIEISSSIADDLAKVHCLLNGRDMDQNRTFIFSSDSTSAYRPVHAIDQMCSSASSTNYSIAS
jgi:hypothetical protein